MSKFAQTARVRPSPVRLSRTRLRASSAAIVAAVSVASLAGPTLAQQAGPPSAGNSVGMRYLSWAGKPAGPTSTDGLRRSNAMASSQPNGPSAAVRYPGIQNAPTTVSRPSRYGVGVPASTAASRQGLTPASAWNAPAPVPMSRMAAPGPASVPYQQPQFQVQQPVAPADPARNQAEADAQAAYQARMQAQYQTQYQAWYQSEAQRQYEAQVQAMPQYREQQVVTQQAPPLQVRADAGPMPMPTGPAPAAAIADPMAPRRDALIYRMQRDPSPAAPDASAQQDASTAAQPKAAGDPIAAPVLSQPISGRTYGGRAYAGAEPPREGARYYSVHRADGRQPDPIAMPESVYLDGGSVDLAEPPATPVQTRTANGRVQTVVPNSDPSLP